MYIADTLSRKGSKPKTEVQFEFCHQVEELCLSEHLPVSSELLQQLHDDTSKDSSLQSLMQVILTKWSDKSPLQV